MQRSPVQLLAAAIVAGAAACGPRPGEPGTEDATPRIPDIHSESADPEIGLDALGILWRRMDALRRSEGVTACTAEISRTHRGWRQSDVEERYGAPSSIDLDETGSLLIYARDSKDSPKIVFTTNDGMVSTACLRER
jgi:hypothetical protein